MSEDFSGVNLVDAHEIITEFSEAGVKIANQQVIDELKKLSVDYNLTPADLYAQWLSYTHNNPNIETLDSVTVEELTARIHQSKIKAAKHNSIKAKFLPKVKPRVSLDILETYVSLGNVKKEPVDDDYKTSDREDSYIEATTPVVIEAEPVDEPMEQVQIAGTPVIPKFLPVRVKIERVEDDLETAEAFPDVEIKVEEDDEMFKKEVLCEFGRQIPFKAWVSLKRDRQLKMSPFDPTRHVSTEEKFFDCNIKKSNIVMDQIFLSTCGEVVKKLSNEENTIPIGNQKKPTEAKEAIYVGRVRMDITDEFDEKVIYFYEDSTSDYQVPMNLDQIKEYSFFPGQTIVALGVKEDKCFRVSEILDTPYLIKPFPKPVKLSQPVNIVTASGPFHLPNSDDFTPLDNLLDYCVIYRPEVLILFGPILEMTPAMFDLFSFQLFDDAIGKISSKLMEVGTRVVIVSSPKEWHTSPAFPTPPYNGYWDNIEFYPSPSVIDINGLTIGLSSVDITLHLTKSLIESRGTSESGNRIKRILRHILVQNSLYPLYPPADDVTLEIPKLNYCRFSSTPHMIILPSMLRNFIHSIEGCVFINPEKIRKNTIARIQVYPSKSNQVTVSKDESMRIGSIESTISAQVIKI